MKKILSTITATILLVCSTSLIAGCDNNNSNNNKNAEVVLESVSATTGIQTQTLTALYSTENSEENSASDSEDKSDNSLIDIPADYIVIFKTQTLLYFTIKLQNPKNYYILDFKLSCEEEDIKVKQGTHYSSINDSNTFIRWDERVDGIGNHQATFLLQLPNPETSPDKIKISELYYSDRTDGTNKTSVNMNNKETYTVYKIDELMKMTDRKNSSEAFYFKLEFAEDVKHWVKVDGVEFQADSDGVYAIPSGKLVVEYEYEVSNGVVYKKVYEEDIETAQVEFEDGIYEDIKSGFYYIKYNKMSGTDIKNYNCKGYFFDKNNNNVNINLGEMEVGKLLIENSSFSPNLINSNSSYIIIVLANKEYKISLL